MTLDLQQLLISLMLHVKSSDYLKKNSSALLLIKRETTEESVIFGSRMSLIIQNYLSVLFWDSMNTGNPEKGDMNI